MEALWAAITQPARLHAWLGEAEVDGRVGARIRLARPVDGIGFITVWDPAWTVEYRWTTGGRPAGIVRWDLERDAAGSGLILVHRRLPRPDVAAYREGWAAALDALAAHVISRRGLSSP